MIPAQRILEAPVLVVEGRTLPPGQMESVLEKEGFRLCYSTADAREAVGLLLRHRPATVVLDFGTDCLDIFEVMAQMQAADPDGYSPVLVLSGEINRESRLKVLSSGAKDILSSPFDMTEVVSRIKNLVEIGLLQRELREQNQRLEERVRDRTRELKDSQIEVVYRLAYACERRDRDTGEHIRRMSRYTACIGRGAGLDENECDLLRHASPMHDIGKIAIPDSILLKAGPLTEEEWAVMEIHAEAGAEMLQGGTSGLVKAGREIALTHHERWDGRGYPHGLAGTDIPLYGRITALADVFDALTSRRCYKLPWSVERSVEEMKRKSGNHFDPQLVEVFLGMLPEILKIKEVLPDPPENDAPAPFQPGDASA